MGLVFLMYGIGGVLLIAISLPMMYDKVPPNGFYGFRTPRTLSDPNVWYPANRVAGRNMALAGVIVTNRAGCVRDAKEHSTANCGADSSDCIDDIADRRGGSLVHRFTQDLNARNKRSRNNQAHPG